ncbi:hypothetical protein [Nannocystis pusilla]|uniref:hypothetical protein n=1 Tax=Nannocystis pusilla TaxID=889268 RepID=UPI003B7AFA35
MGDPAADALACIGPQGIDGCGMESPLEAMRRALDLEARWNIGERPFLRPGAPLAVVIVTDETDCSTLNFAYFDPKLHDDPEFSKYWPSHPSSGQRTEPTSAVCWNAGMTCADDDDDGEYEWCMSEDKHVLQPVTRYTEALADLRHLHGKEVVMLVLGGVPQVTEHNQAPPFEPLAGGVDALVYRDWQPEDILPGDTDTLTTSSSSSASVPAASAPPARPSRPGGSRRSARRSTSPTTPTPPSTNAPCAAASSPSATATTPRPRLPRRHAAADPPRHALKDML